MIKVEFDVDEAALGIPVAEAVDRIRESLGLNGAWYELPCNVADKVYENKVTIDQACGLIDEARRCLDIARKAATATGLPVDAVIADLCEIAGCDSDGLNVGDAVEAVKSEMDSVRALRDSLLAKIKNHYMARVAYLEQCIERRIKARALDISARSVLVMLLGRGEHVFSTHALAVSARLLVDDLRSEAVKSKEAHAAALDEIKASLHVALDIHVDNNYPISELVELVGDRVATLELHVRTLKEDTADAKAEVEIMSADLKQKRARIGTLQVENSRLRNEEKPTCGECANLDRTTTACGVCRVNRTWRTFDQEICRNEFARRAPESKPVCSACGWFRGSAMHKAGVCAKNATCVSGGNEACELFVRR